MNSSFSRAKRNVHDKEASVLWRCILEFLSDYGSCPAAGVVSYSCPLPEAPQ